MSTKTGSSHRSHRSGNLSKAMVEPSTELAVVIGAGAVSRPEVTKKVWDYIKAHGLQDAMNKRMINADAALRPIFGGREQVSMFEMTSLVNAHLSPVVKVG